MAQSSESNQAEGIIAGTSEIYFEQAEKLIAQLREERDQLRLDYAIELAHSAGLVTQIQALREERNLAVAS